MSIFIGAKCSDESVKLGIHVHLALLVDKINGK